MQNIKTVYLNLIILSASIICFEILTTRIASVIFVSNYAFIVLSLAISGLGSGGIYAYFRIKADSNTKELFRKQIIKYFILCSASIILFIVCIVMFSITNTIIYFFLLFVPFFISGIIYSLLFKTYSEYGFKIYAADLGGAAIGAILSLLIFNFFTAPNAVLFLAFILFFCAINFAKSEIRKKLAMSFYSVWFLVIILLFVFGKEHILGEVPIGNYPEKDFYYVYEGIDFQSKIVESRWSINGRADLVEYNFQDKVKQLFIDGAAGSPMYSFNGNIKNHDKLLNKLLLDFTTSIPFLFLSEEEKQNMLIIGPGGGKEILIGMLGGVRNITGVEVNSDFIELVKKNRSFNGGIYTDFPNIKIIADEGRHFIKRTDKKWDIILLSLPSTKQIQNINNLSANENFLLTKEAIKEYLKVLSAKGQLIFTVHNRWELVRLIVTTIYAFKENGVNSNEALNHLAVIGSDYEPTLIVRKTNYNENDIKRIENVSNSLPKDFHKVTFIPRRWDKIDNSIENSLLKTIKNKNLSVENYIENYEYDISPVLDDCPYFYKIFRGVPSDYLNLLIIVALLSFAVVIIPSYKIKIGNPNRLILKELSVPLVIFICSGLGFMILEVSLFQKLILFIGSPTISLAILLSSLLVGMGIGSYFSGKLFANNPLKRIVVISILIIIVGAVIFAMSQVMFNEFIMLKQLYRILICFILLSPFGFLLGIPFPTAIEILRNNNKEIFIPWMYGVNGIFTVLGSISAVILSMLFGFSFSFFGGLSIYLIIFLIVRKSLYGMTKK